MQQVDALIGILKEWGTGWQFALMALVLFLLFGFGRMCVRSFVALFRGWPPVEKDDEKPEEKSTNGKSRGSMFRG